MLNNYTLVGHLKLKEAPMGNVTELDNEIDSYYRDCEQMNIELVNFIQQVGDLLLTALDGNDLVFRQFIFSEKIDRSASHMDLAVAKFPIIDSSDEMPHILDCLASSRAEVARNERLCRREFVQNLVAFRDGENKLF